MRGRRLVRRGVVLVAVLAVGVVGAVGAVPPPTASAEEEVTPLTTPGMAVPLERAGELRLWGDNTFDQATVPASLQGVAISQVVFPSAATLALTADGRVVGWGGNIDRLQQVPAEVASTRVVQIATGTYGSGYAGVVTRDGRVLTWGKKRAFETPLDVPAGLSGVTQLVMAEYSAAALKADGTVVSWGMEDSGQTEVPEGLKATAIAASSNTYFALTEEGTVETWGLPPRDALPAATQVPGNVKAIVSSSTVLALLADNTLVVLDGSTPPPEFLAGDPVLVSTGGLNEFAILDHDRAIHYWWWGDGGSAPRPAGEVPEELNGQNIAQIALGFSVNAVVSYPASLVGGVIVTKMLPAAAPRVTGTPRVGSTLTAIPGTFSASPESVTGQWLVNGAPIAGATGATLTVTAAMAGQRISYRSTATKTGEGAVSSSSSAVTVAPPAKVASRTSVLKVAVAKRAVKVGVTGKVTASKSPAGKAKVTIKKGRKLIIAKTVRVTANGAVALVVKGFARLVAQKTHTSSKTAYRGKYTVTIAYAGNAQVNPSHATKRFTIRR